MKFWNRVRFHDFVRVLIIFRFSKTRVQAKKKSREKSVNLIGPKLLREFKRDFVGYIS